jgi:PDZ domain-containing protein
MGQRWVAGAIAGVLLAVLAATAAFMPLPYAVYSPGPTFDVLAEDHDNAELIQIDGSEVDVHYDQTGEIRFTTVRATARDRRLGLYTLMKAWLASDQAVVPHDVAHPPGRTAEQDREEGQLLMASSQDTAKAVALQELGYELPTSIQAISVGQDSAAEGILLAGDVFLRADGKRVRTSQDVVDAVTAHEPGDPVSFQIRRKGKLLDVEVAPAEVDGESRIGVMVGENYEFPFEIKIRVDEAIGGPSAGLMFALAIYDTLTPDQLTKGGVIAGTGTVDAEGNVGPIGGVVQKISGAEDAGAGLFLVPAENCADVAGLDPDLVLVKAETMASARQAVEAWADDPTADLPSC